MTVDPRAFRDRHKYYAALASEIAAPALRLAARAVTRRAPSAPSTWRRGLIVGHTHLGDVLYRTCSLPQLRGALPDCSWTYLTSPASAALLRGNPYLDSVLPLNTGDNPYNVTADGLRELRQQAFDVVLCTNSITYHQDLRLALRLGIPNRVAFIHKGFSGLATHGVQLNQLTPYAAHFQQMVASLAARSPSWPLRPEIYLTRDDRQLAARAWSDLRLSPTVPVYACTMTTRQDAGAIAPDFFVRVLRALRERSNVQIVLCGSADDAPILRSAAHELGAPCAILAGTLAIRPFAAFIERCAALFAHDSGPRHIANAVQTPVVFVRNLSMSAVGAGQYCDTEFDAAPPGEYLRAADIARLIAGVDVGEVADLLLQRQRVRAPSPEHDTRVER